MGADVCKRRPREGARTQRPWGADTRGSATRGRARTARLRPGGGPGRTLLPRGRAGGRRVREERLGLAVCEGRAGAAWRLRPRRPRRRGETVSARSRAGRAGRRGTRTVRLHANHRRRQAPGRRREGGRARTERAQGQAARRRGLCRSWIGGGVSVFPLILFFGFELKFSLPSNKERG